MQLCTHKWRKQIERQPRLSIFIWDVSVHTLIFPKEVLVRANGKEEEKKQHWFYIHMGFISLFKTCFTSYLLLLPYSQGVTRAGSFAYLFWQSFMPRALPNINPQANCLLPGQCVKLCTIALWSH